MIRSIFQLIGLIFMIPALYAQTAVSPAIAAHSTDLVHYTLPKNNHEGITLQVTFPDPGLVKSALGEQYYRLVLPGCYGANAEGKPNLPLWNTLIEIPVGTNYTITVTDEIWLDLPIPSALNNLHVEPVQLSRAKSDRSPLQIVKDTSVYQRNEWFSYGLAGIFNDGVMRNTRIARLQVSPVEYHPVQGLLRYLASATIRIDYDVSPAEEVSPASANFASPFFDIASYTINRLSMPESIPDGPVRYVILSDPMFQSALQPFIAWKRRKGFIVTEVYKGDPGVGTTAIAMKGYLDSLYHAATPSEPAPSFLLIVGDTPQIPAFSGTSAPHPTDFYYAEYTGDMYPEVLYGRFSATTVAHLQAQIEKTLHVEQYLMSDPSYLQDMILVAGVDATFAAVWGNGHIHYAANEYVNSNNNLAAHTWFYPSSTGQSAQVINRFNQGASLVNYTAHANSSGWENPAFTNSQVATLTNTGKYPTVISNACSSNDFGKASCFGETLLRASQKGAAGHIGGSNLTYWDEDYYFAVGFGPIVQHPYYGQGASGFYDRLFHTNGEPFSEWAVTQGAIINAGNMSVALSGSVKTNYYREIYHLMGDPSLMPWLGIPDPVLASFPASLPTGLNQVVVQAPPYSYVAITGNGIVYGATVADQFGNATVFIDPPTTPVSLELVITGQNLIPFFDTIHFVTPTGPFVMADSVAFLDYAGNNNQQIDAGELIHVDVQLKNFTGFASGAVTISLLCNDPYITLVDSVISIPAMQGLASQMLQNAFAFNIALFVPSQHHTEVTIQVDDGIGIRVSKRSFVINSPNITITNIILTDDDGDGVVSPGEDFSFTVHLTNSGSADLQGLPIQLMHDSPYLVLGSNTHTLPQFIAGTPYTITMQGTAINSAIPHGAVVKVVATAALHGYADTLTTYRMLAPAVEDFGKGLSHLPWSFTGSQPWHLVTEDPFKGTSCARSGAIPNQSATSMSITLPIISRDSISFFYRVSSEEDFDELKFSINQMVLGRWSGDIMTWQRAAFPVDSGEVTFSWTYEKDYTVHAGHDCAWIDYILFPATSLYSGIPKVHQPQPQLHVYPNPSKGSVTVVLNQENPEGGNLIIFSANGRKVYQRTFTQGEKLIVLNEGMTSPGLYILYIETPSAKIQKKIVRF